MTPDGHNEFNNLSFGPGSAHATFRQLADNVFKDIKWKEVLIYLDDIVVFSRFRRHDIVVFVGRIPSPLGLTSSLPALPL